MAIQFTYPLFYLFNVCFSIFIVLLSASQPLVLNLIHPKNLHSEPLNVTWIEEASKARMLYLQSKASGVISHLSPNEMSGAFLVNISIGNPPSIQLLDMDTASDLTWLQCLPCRLCFEQEFPIFDPTKSSTYSNEFDSCTSSPHHRLRYNAITASCEYALGYMDDSESKGTLAKETMIFSTTYGEGSSASLADATFGCGHYNPGKTHVGSGLFGLGYGKLSLVHRFDSKFSYCFGSLDDTTNPHNVLVIGDDDEDIMGDTSPLEIEDGLYYISMEGISVEGTLLPINAQVFKRDYRTGSEGTIIDTGTALTYLVKEAYDKLVSKVDDIFEGRFKNAYISQKVKCYYGDIERDLVDSGFPVVTFHFSDGAELSLDVKSMFFKGRTGVFCLTVTPSSSNDKLNIIGAMAQQNYNIGYDLKENTISFERIDCGILFDN